MDESTFNQMVDEVIEQLEEAIDDSLADIDYDTVGGILTLMFENESKIILNRQTPVKQIWVATKGGGFHFDYDPDSESWLNDNDKQELFEALSEYCTEQAGTDVNLND